jgi:hypothetical protein
VRLRRGSIVAHLLGLQVRIRRGAWISVSCKCCVLSGRERFLHRADHSSREVLPTVVRLSVIVKRWPSGGLLRHGEKLYVININFVSVTIVTGKN